MAVRSNTHGAKSSIAESTAAGSGQSQDKGYDGGANHVFRCLLAFAIGIMSGESSQERKKGWCQARLRKIARKRWA
jgi:hypothetical protein